MSVSLYFLDRVLEQVILIDLVDLGDRRRLYYIAFEGVTQRDLVDHQPRQDEEAEVLDPSKFDSLEDGELDSDALGVGHAHAHLNACNVVQIGL